MKNITYNISLILLLICANSIYGQNQLDDYYYYKGEKVFLNINTKAISISFEGENSISAFKSIKNNSNKTSEIIEDKTRSIVNSIDNNAEKRKSLKAYYLEVSTKKELTKREYLNQIENLKKYDNTLMVSPTYKNKQNTEFGLSNNFFVKLKSQKDVSLLYRKAKEFGIEVLGHNQFMPLWFTLSIKTPQNYNALNLANIFYETGLFESTEPAFMYHDLQNSNDPFFKNQWALKNTGQNGGNSGIDIDIEQAWKVSTGNNIKVAVIDEGIELNHPDLITNIIGTGYDTQTNTTPSRVSGNHGVACAGIIGAIKDNNIGVAGVAPNSGLISISVSFSRTTYQMLANGVNWAWQNGADVISNSWGGGSPSSFFDGAINNALSNGRSGLGCVIVFSAGNDNNNVAYPANSNPNILAVGAMSPCGERKNPSSCDGENWWGSNFGTQLDVVAPGVLIPTTDRQGRNGYTTTDYTQTFNGTSSSCPIVAGVAALVLKVNPNLTYQGVNDIIEKSAQKVRTDLYTYSNKSGRSNGTWNNQLGYGLVDAYQAVLLAQGGEDCESDLNITQNVNAGEIDVQEAINSITATNTIANTATAEYDAGKNVHIKPGFHAKNGSSFRAYIDGCDTQSFELEQKTEPELFVTYERITINNDIVKEDQEIIKTFPNPVKNMLVIKSQEQILSWELKNHLGKLVNTSKSNRKAFIDDKINVSQITTGFYVLKINLTNGKTIYKNIIKN